LQTNPFSSALMRNTQACTVPRHLTPGRSSSGVSEPATRFVLRRRFTQAWLDRINGSPVVHEGIIYFGGDDDYLYAIASSPAPDKPSK
jgi:hypothetical protein